MMERGDLAAGTRCTVTVPASTSNLGPGFDAIGCALKLANRFEFTVEESDAQVTVSLSGPRSAGIPPTPRNLAITTARNFIQRCGLEAPPLSLNAHIAVPSARGLGSSSTAIVAGLLAGNALCGYPLNQEQLLALAVEIEGHPDNVAPAILGGFVVSASESSPLCYRKYAVHESIRFIFVIPDYEVRTADARNALPKTISLNDGIFNASRTPLVVLGLLQGDSELLAEALEDRFHQPYRKPLFKFFDELKAASIRAGASGFCVSGAGPTMLAIATKETAKAVTASIQEAMAKHKLTGEVRELEPDQQGSVVTLERSPSAVRGS